MVRTHRTWAQKLCYAETFRCPKCDRRLKRTYPGINVMFRFTFSRSSHCIRCGTPNVQRLKKRDRIDSVSTNLVSLLIALTGAPFNRCPICRLQYHDWRRPDSRFPRPEVISSPIANKPSR